MQENNPIHQAFPSSELNESIRHDVQNRASSLHARRQHKTIVRRAVLGSFASVGIIVCAATVGPKAYAYYGMQRIGGSLDDCKSLILEEFQLDRDGKFHSASVVMYSHGKWRIERSGTTQVYANQWLWRYEPELNQVTKRFRPEGPFGFNSSGFSVKAQIADNIRFGWQRKTTLSNGELNFKPVEVLTIEQSMPQMRDVIYADPKTHMPIRSSSETMVEGKWRERSYGIFKIDSTIDEKLFKPNFPASAKVIDLEKVKSGWKKKLETVLATFHTNEGTIALRDIAVTERGHIFLVYTNGETAIDRKAYGDTMRRGEIPKEYFRPSRWSIEDTVGNSYWPSSKTDFQPYDSPVRNMQREFVVLKDGQVLHGNWYIPSMPNKWSSREITLNCWTPKADKFAGTYKFKIQTPTDKLIPDWMSLCAMGPFTAKQIYQEENEPQPRIGAVPDMGKTGTSKK
jgi:outer membrane lipoprotein-sorting protein